MSELSIPTKAMVEFLAKLLLIPSPTGYHAEAIPFVRHAFEGLNIPELALEYTRKGALLIHWRGDLIDAPRGVTAHVDTLGLMVKEIKPNGALKVTSLGGIMWQGIEFENVTIRTHDDRRYRGTVIPVNPSAHVNRNITTQERSMETMEVRIDARTSSAEETQALGINVGDFVFLDPRVEIIDTGFIRSRFLDNKAGVAVIYGALLAMKNAGLHPIQNTTFLIANYEEVGHGGASGLPDNLAELLTIDMAAIGEGQNSDEFSVTICAKDGSGPYHFNLTRKLRNIAEAYDIPYKMDIYKYYSSDGSAYWRAGGDAEVALIGPGVASSHAYERLHEDSLTDSAHLLVRYLLEDD